MTYGQATSRVINSLNSLTKDMRISKRYVLSVLKEVGAFLLSQKILDKTLYRETELFKWIRCVEMKSDDIVKCPIVEFRRCDSVMRSKKKLPKIVGSRYGYAILSVTTIDGSRKLSFTTLSEYTNMIRRRNYKKFIGTRYYISDGYLYIPDSEIEVVDLLLLTLDEDYEDCSSCSEKPNCQSVWDTELPLPDKFGNVVLNETIKEVAMRLNIRQDVNGNLDPNILSQTIQ